MKAGTKIVRAASAMALSSTVLASATLGAQLALVTVAGAAVVSSIDVRGNSQVEASTVRSFIGIQPGQDISVADQDAAVRRLFSTGLFSDVSVRQSGSTLIVEVEENRIVNQVLFRGNTEIEDAALAQAVGLEPRGAYSPQRAEAGADRIREAYGQIGRTQANVSVNTQSVGEGQVNVVYTVQEGGRSTISAINFVGNNAFGETRLERQMELQETGILSWLRRNDVYSERQLEADKESIQRFYYNRGYADFRILSAVADRNPTDNSYVVTITVDEGDRYTFGAITIDSTIPNIDTQALYGTLETQEGEVYSAEEVEESIIALSDALANDGYAFAQVTPRGDRNFAARTIGVNYVIDEGPRAYVERIEIRGNTKTRDYVIRREFDVSEGDAFNQVLVQRAKQNLEDLGYFQTVEISTRPGTEPDRVILIVDVSEKATGELSLGGGYTTGGDGSGPVAEVGITERNFLGRGQFIKVSAGFGTNRRSYNLSFTEPYFLGRRLAAGFDVYYNETDGDDYDTERVGGDVRFAAPITENLTAQIAYNYKEETFGEDNGIDIEDDNGDEFDITCGNPTPEGFAGATRNGISSPFTAPPYTESPIINEAICDSPYKTSSVSYSLTYNTLDDVQQPREGLRIQAGQEFAGLGGDANFMKTTGGAAAYTLLSEQFDVIGSISATGGNVTELGGDGLRVFDNFFKGQEIVRGFETRGIGPRQNDVSIGGENYASASVEATFPLPLIDRDLGFRGAIFADAGSLWGSDFEDEPGVQGTDADLRASAGVGLIWASPFGPIRVNYAEPLAKEDFDELQKFSFGFSSRF